MVKLSKAQYKALKTAYEAQRAGRTHIPRYASQSTLMSLNRMGLLIGTVMKQRYMEGYYLDTNDELTYNGFVLADSLFNMDWWEELMQAFIEGVRY